MSQQLKFIFFIIIATGCVHQGHRDPNSQSDGRQFQNQILEMINYSPLNVKIRAGYSMENDELKACVIYLEGLADSVRNHNPYFSFLNAAGYRIIYFDYMGQGGSEGSMNNTRIKVELPTDSTKEMIRKYEQKDKYWEIPEQADFVWSYYREKKNSWGQDCHDSKKIIIGWSTGGLAAYRMAAESRADAVILLAPGIHPKWMAGEAAHRWDKMLSLQQVITERTLTRNRFIDSANPHLDPISPKSPIKVPQFAGNLVGVAKHAEDWTIPKQMPGIVFLSSDEDTYIEARATVNTIQKQAPQFIIKSYEGALHELDNELINVANDVQDQTVKFLDNINQ